MIDFRNCFFETTLEEHSNLEQLLEKFKSDKYVVLLDSSLKSKKLGRYSIVGVKPILCLQGSLNNFEVMNYSDLKMKFNTKRNSFFEVQREILRSLPKFTNSLNCPFNFGFLGYFGYEFLNNSTKKNFLEVPDAFFMIPSEVYILDNWMKKAQKIVLKGFELKEEKYLQSKCKQKDLKIDDELTYTEYKRDFNYLKERIVEGDIYEACLTYKIFIDGQIEPLITYNKLRNGNKAPFASFLKISDQYILGSSPERFLCKRDSIVEMRPIKGTIKRGENIEEDKLLRNKLKSSLKDKAENVMIVDLIRNDLGRVSKFGSVKVDKLFSIEKYASLFQMVSIISSELEKGKDVFDVLKATFPGGSMTGAPKIRAMAYLDLLEKTKRGVYSGCMGYIDINGDADFNIVIRTLIYDAKRQKGYLQVGGAIVYDSIVEEEFSESKLKAKKILEILRK